MLAGATAVGAGGDFMKEKTMLGSGMHAASTSATAIGKR
jgi:hypothetical protein